MNRACCERAASLMPSPFSGRASAPVLERRLDAAISRTISRPPPLPQAVGGHDDVLVAQAAAFGKYGRLRRWLNRSARASFVAAKSV